MNRLIQPYVEGVRQAVACTLFDPLREHILRDRFRRPDVRELGLANSLFVPGGRWPARGWVLLSRKDLDKIDHYATNFQLELDDLTLYNLSIVQARCVSRGTAQDPTAIYLVELTDGRGVLYNRWFSFPTTSQYNIRAPAYPEEYYSSTLNGVVPWTWDGLLADMWAQMGTFLGSYPNLPVVPDASPEGWSFVGVSAWQALCDVLEQLGMEVAVDLTSTTPYTIVQGGAADASFTARSATYADRLEEDLEYLDTGSGRVPKTVMVLFHRRNQYYGTEETIRRDSLQWQSTPFYSVSVPGPFTSATGTAYIWDDFTVRFDVDGNPLAADVATAAALAAEQTTEFFQNIYRATLGAMRRVYTGALPFRTGSQVDGVRWYHDYSQGRGGWRTEVIRGWTWPIVRFDQDVDGLGEMG